MTTTRRDFLKRTSLAGVSLAVGASDHAVSVRGEEPPAQQPPAYKYRVAFGAWINDMRNEPLPLQGWPAPQFDDETIRSVTAAMDVQGRAGFNYLDAWGLFATYGYPPDIVSAFADQDRRARVKQLIQAAAERGIKYLFGMGLFSWGYDEIIRAEPSVRGRNKAGQPMDHVMCGATDKAWAYVEKILDSALGEFDFAGVHLESADLGWCDCPECGGKYGTVGYNARLNIRAADYIKRKWPGKIVTCIPINWLGGSGRQHFNDAEQAEIIELSKHIDCFMDQGWTGTYIADDRRKEFIGKLHCDYGTSGGLWVYHCARWNRLCYFLPYAQRTTAAIRRHYEDGARGAMIYQGPVINPAVEVNVAVSGRMLSDTRRNVEDVLAEVVKEYYQPKTPVAQQKLVELFLRAEDAYFGQWDPARFAAAKWPMPGELHVSNLFGNSPGAATYLLEPFLTADGRKAYKKDLIAVLKDLGTIEDAFSDAGRIARIKRSITSVLNVLDSVRAAKGEPWSAD